MPNKNNNNNTFSELIEALNKKWGHTYQNVPGDAKAEKDTTEKEEK